MISANYIFNGHEESVFNDDFYTCEKFLDDTLNEFNKEYMDYQCKVESALLESSVMGIRPDEETRLFVEEADKNMLAKLGKAIIEMGKKLIKFIEEKITQMKDRFFKYKSNEKKLAELIKKHPELGQEKIKLLCDEGALDFSDMKSLSELDKEFERIVKLAKQGEEDPTTLKAKWNKAVKKWVGDEGDSATKVNKAAVAATSVITLIVLVRTFGPKIAESRKKMLDLKLDQQKVNDEVYKILCSDSDFDQSSGYHATILAMNRERQGHHMAAIRKHNNAIEKVENAIADTLDKIAGGQRNADKIEAMKTDNEQVAKMLNNREINDSYLKQIGKQHADSKYVHSKQYTKDEAAKKKVNDNLNGKKEPQKIVVAFDKGKNKKGKPIDPDGNLDVWVHKSKK